MALNTMLDDLADDARLAGGLLPVDSHVLLGLKLALEQAEVNAATHRSTPTARRAARRHLTCLLRQHAVERAQQ